MVSRFFSLFWRLVWGRVLFFFFLGLSFSLFFCLFRSLERECIVLGLKF